MTKCLVFACCAVVAGLMAEQAFQVYAGYYGVATVLARGCTVVATNPFKLDLH